MTCFLKYESTNGPLTSRKNHISGKNRIENAGLFKLQYLTNELSYNIVCD